MPNKEELQAAFAILDAHPFKISKDSQPHTASFVDDNPENPVQICDSKGNPLLLMSLEDYKAALEHKPVSMGCKVVECLPTTARTPSSEFSRLEDAAMDEILRGSLLPAHMLQGTPFEEDPTWKREHQGEVAPPAITTFSLDTQDACERCEAGMGPACQRCQGREINRMRSKYPDWMMPKGTPGADVKARLQTAIDGMPREPEPPTVTRTVTLTKPLEYIHLTLQVPEGDVELHATRLEAPTFELKGPPVPPPPAKLLDPSFNTKEPKE